MAKNREVVPAAAVLLPAEVARQQIATAISQQPDLVSYDPTEPANEALALRCAVDPGIPAQQRDGWTGLVCNWALVPQEVEEQGTGELKVLPSLCLVAACGELCRLYGWPAVSSFARIIRAAGAERCRQGIKVKVARRASGTAGRSYWLVLPQE